MFWRLLIAPCCPFCRRRARKTQSSSVVRVSKLCIFFLNSLLLLPPPLLVLLVLSAWLALWLWSPLCSLSNNDLLSLDPYSPNLAAAPAFAASSSTGKSTKVSFCFHYWSRDFICVLFIYFHIKKTTRWGHSVLNFSCLKLVQFNEFCLTLGFLSRHISNRRQTDNTPCVAAFFPPLAKTCHHAHMFLLSPVMLLMHCDLFLWV